MTLMMRATSWMESTWTASLWTRSRTAASKVLRPGLQALASLALERRRRQREPELRAVAAHHEPGPREPRGLAPRRRRLGRCHRQPELGVGAGGVLRAHGVEVDDRGGDDLDVLAAGAALERPDDVGRQLEQTPRPRLDADVDIARRVGANALADEGLLVVEEADADDAARGADDADLGDAVRAVGEPAPGGANDLGVRGRAAHACAPPAALRVPSFEAGTPSTSA
jgi:hypothetical protein